LFCDYSLLADTFFFNLRTFREFSGLRDIPVVYPGAGLLLTGHIGSRREKFSAKTVQWRSHSWALWSPRLAFSSKLGQWV
jgi:hypothetical protein